MNHLQKRTRTKTTATSNFKTAFDSAFCPIKFVEHVRPGMIIYLRRKSDNEWTQGATELVQRYLDFALYAYDGFMLAKDYKKLILGQ